MPRLHRDTDALATRGLLPWLARLQRGIEKESLRVSPQGQLSQQPHPAALGSALTHPSITTDFSEALLEFITAPHDSPESMLAELDDIHRFTCAHIGDEILWASSMPCFLGEDHGIPLAQYGRSNNARMKTTYRMGLSWRYGRRMQTIAGIHYNFSLPDGFWAWYARNRFPGEGWQDLRNRSYFGLIRNFRRYSWLLLYLFGASPAVCRSFLAGRQHGLEALGEHTLLARWGTSLRMGDLGYQSNAQENLYVCYNSLREYTRSLRTALATPHPEYTRIGTRVDGEYRQLRDTVLQIENEFYSSIRPKRVARSGQTPTAALEESGVQYIEVRCMDLNPFLPLGIDAGTVRFLDLFLLGCLFWDSPATDPAEYRRIRENTRRTVYAGRHPHTTLQDGDGERPLRDWAGALLQALQPIAGWLDQACGGHAYRQSWELQQQRLAQPQLTPSAQVLSQLQARDCAYARFALEQSQRHSASFRQRPLDAARAQAFARMAAASLEKQQRIEAADSLPFDEFLQRYFAQ